MTVTKLIALGILLVGVSMPILADTSLDGRLHIGFVAGLAVPNEQVSQFYADSRQQFNLESINGIGEYVLEQAATLGYTIGIKGRLSLAQNIDFVPALGLTRFNKGNYNLELPVGTTQWDAEIQSTTNVISIGAGFNVFLWRTFLSPYVVADLNYHYTSYSCDFVWKRNVTIPVASSTQVSTDKETANTLGYSFGAGIDIDLSLVILNLEAKWNTLNLIKSNTLEPQKNHVSFTVGVIF